MTRWTVLVTSKEGDNDYWYAPTDAGAREHNWFPLADTSRPLWAYATAEDAYAVAARIRIGVHWVSPYIGNIRVVGVGDNDGRAALIDKLQKLAGSEPAGEDGH